MNFLPCSTTEPHILCQFDAVFWRAVLRINCHPAKHPAENGTQKRLGICQSVESELYGSEPILDWAQQWLRSTARDPGTGLAAPVSPEQERKQRKETDEYINTLGTLHPLGALQGNGGLAEADD
jgi:hypothetical protein